MNFALNHSEYGRLIIWKESAGCPIMYGWRMAFISMMKKYSRLGKAGVGVTHCPSSNMVLGSGQCRTLDLEQAGSPVGLGVDGSASSDCSNLIQEVRQAMLLQRLHYGSAAISHFDAYRWVTKGSAAALVVMILAKLL